MEVTVRTRPRAAVAVGEGLWYSMALLTMSVERMTCTRALPSWVMARRMVFLLMVFRFLYGNILFYALVVSTRLMA